MKDLTEHAAFSSQSVNTAYCVYWFLPRCSFADTGLRWTAALRANSTGPVCLDIKKLREVWKTFLTLTGASPLIALCAAMDRNRLRKAVKSCEKKKNIYICKLHTLCVLVNEYINYRCQRNGCLVHWGNHIVEHFNLDDFILVWLVLFNCS